MKLLMFYVDLFRFRPTVRASDEFDDEPQNGEVQDAVLGFIQVEEEDEQKISHSTTKLIKNLKWLAGKNDTKKIILHSFSHLSESKASARVVKEIFANASARLQNAGYEVSQTPLGYVCDIELKAPGSLLARILKSF